MRDVDSGGFGAFGLGLLLEFGGFLILGWKLGGWIGDFYEKIRMFGLFRQTFALNLLAGY